MGFHICEYCQAKGNNMFPGTSSGDNKIETEDVIIWFPDMVLHYITDHNWLPPHNFIEIIMNYLPEVIACKRVQYQGTSEKKVERIGYLSGSFPRGSVPSGFIQRLQTVMSYCSCLGTRMQTKG